MTSFDLFRFTQFISLAHGRRCDVSVADPVSGLPIGSNNAVFAIGFMALAGGISEYFEMPVIYVSPVP